MPNSGTLCWKTLPLLWQCWEAFRFIRCLDHGDNTLIRDRLVEWVPIKGYASFVCLLVFEFGLRRGTCDGVHTEVRGQLCGSQCSSTLYYPWLNSRHTTWQQEPLSAGQSHQLLASFYMCALTLTFSSPIHRLPQDDKARRAWHLDSECLLCRIEVFFFSA